MRDPGRNRPSLREAPDELDGRDPEPEDGRGERGVEGPKSSVAPSLLEAGVPQEEQKRLEGAISVPQATQGGMKLVPTVYRDPVQRSHRSL